MNSCVFFGILVFISLTVAGCHPRIQMIGEYDKDVTEIEKYWGGYVPGNHYEVRTDLFLKIVTKNETTRFVIVAPNSYQGRVYSSPENINEYINYPSAWPDIEGIIKEKTLIECIMIRKTGTLMWPEGISVFGQIKEGQYINTIVDLEDISIFENNTLKPDERFLADGGPLQK